MKDLRDKASEGPDATRFKEVEAGDTFRIENPALYPADDISPEDEYPFHGDWFSLIDGDGEQTGHLECPRALAQAVLHAVDHDDVGFPMLIEIRRAELVDDEWRASIDAEEVE